MDLLPIDDPSLTDEVTWVPASPLPEEPVQEIDIPQRSQTLLDAGINVRNTTQPGGGVQGSLAMFSNPGGISNVSVPPDLSASGGDRSVRMAPEPDIYDVIEADNTAMERVIKSKTRDMSSTPTHSSNHSIIGRGSRGILKRGKSRRAGSDSIHAGFSDVKSVSRFDPDEPPRSYLQSREESMQNENEGSTAASPGTMLGRHLGRLNFPAQRSPRASEVSGLNTPCKQHAEDGMVNVNSKRCSHDTCTKWPCFNIEGSEKGAYCKQHAKTGMVNVRDKCCSHATCTRIPSFNTEGSKTKAYCRKHAENSMVPVGRKRCSTDTCTRTAFFSVEGSRKAAHCRQHADNGMVDVRSNSCSHDTCTRVPSFNVEGSRKAAYCRQHAENGMVDIRHKSCSHETCSRRPSFNVVGCKTAAYCKQHAEGGMVNVRNKRCSHATCLKQTSWKKNGSKEAAYCKEHYVDGIVDAQNTICSTDAHTTQSSLGSTTSRVGTISPSHKSSVPDGPLTNFTAVWEVTGCEGVSTRGLNAEQPSLCGKHGSLEDGFVLSLQPNRPKKVPRGSPDPALGFPSPHVKTECYF